MDVDAKILARIDELIAMGAQVLDTRRPPPSVVMYGDSRVDGELANQWVTSCQNILQRVFGTESAHYQNFTKETAEYVTFSPAESALGILRAAKDDYEHDHLFDVRQLIQAEVFDDFLEQAQHLFDSGYYQPAAVVAGSVLEDGLRKLCDRHGVPLPDKPKLDKMNADLAKQGVYSKLKQKQITAFADLRNKAAHGQWDQFTKDDVPPMLDGVRHFMEKHFT